MKLVLVCAIGKNREIGRGGTLVWRISEDLKRFKRITMGHPVIMGRKTHESIGKPLPGRTNIIVTRQPGFAAEGCITAHSIEQALEAASVSEGGDTVFVIGGGQLYDALIGRADRLSLTAIDASADDADTWFPEYESSFSVLHDEGPYSQDSLNYRFLELLPKHP